MYVQVIDLFCGLKGWSAAFEDRGHDVFTVDIDPSFNPSLTADILELNPSILPAPDIVLASPPCESFSVASIGHHWGGGEKAYQPKTPAAVKGMEIVKQTLNIIDFLRPRWSIVENPRGVLRKLDIIPVAPQTIWYCHYGETRAKPTDLWGLPFPKALALKPVCHNNVNHKPGCCCYDHEHSPRGDHNFGTQAMKGYSNRSKIPYALSLEVCMAAEKSLQYTTR